MALDEATIAFMTAAAEQGGPPLHEMSAQEIRDMNVGLAELYGPGPELAKVENTTITTHDRDEIPVRVFTPENPRGVIVYYHGGGWAVGTADGFDTLCRQIADRTSMTVVFPEYRMAPEDRYPTAAEDAWATLTWAAENRAGLAGSADAPLIAAGDSAGGNLTAVVAQRAVREGGPELALQGLIYPVVEADFDNTTYNDPENELFLTKQSMINFWDWYCPDEMDRENWDVAPVHGDAKGAAPAVVLVAEHDVLRGEGEKYAQKLRADGVEVTEHMVAGQMHGFFTFPNVLPGAAEGLDLFVAAVDEVVS